MKKFLVLYMTPSAELDAWKAKPEDERKADETKMQGEWQAWMQEHGSTFTETGGAGSTKLVTPDGVSDIKNDIMLYSIVEGESADDVAKLFVGHPHFGIPESTIQIMAMNALPGMGA